MHRRGKLATFDRSIAALLPEGKRKSDWIVELSCQAGTGRDAPRAMSVRTRYNQTFIAWLIRF
jgi:hypothetical protein